MMNKEKMVKSLETRIAANEKAGKGSCCDVTMKQNGAKLHLELIHHDWDPVEIDDEADIPRISKGASLKDFDAIAVSGHITAKAVQYTGDIDTVLENLLHYDQILTSLDESADKSREGKVRRMVEKEMRQHDAISPYCALRMKNGETVFLEAISYDATDDMVPGYVLPSIADGSYVTEYDEIRVYCKDAEAMAYIEGDGKPSGVIERLAEYVIA